MSSDLKVDTAALRKTGRALLTIAHELQNAESLVDSYKSAIGNQTLEHRLDDMQGSWDDRRNDLIKKIEGVADVVKQAGEAFEEVERSLVAALRGK